MFLLGSRGCRESRHPNVGLPIEGFVGFRVSLQGSECTLSVGFGLHGCTRGGACCTSDGRQMSAGF